MKTTKILIALFAMVMTGVVTSCQSDDELIETVAPKEELKFNVTVGDKLGFGEGTRATAAGWEVGDEILAVFDITQYLYGDNDTAEKEAETANLNLRQVLFTYDGTKWVAEKKDGFDFNESGYFTAIYAKDLKDSYFKYQSLWNANIYTKENKGINGFVLVSDKLDYTYDKTTKTLSCNIKFDRIMNDVKITVTGLPANWYLNCFNETAGRTESVSNLMKYSTAMYHFTYQRMTSYNFINNMRSGPNPITSWSSVEWASLNDAGEAYFGFNTGATIGADDYTVFRVADKDVTRVWQRSVNKKLRQNLAITIKGPVDANKDEAVGYVDANNWELIYLK